MFCCVCAVIWLLVSGCVYYACFDGCGFGVVDDLDCGLFMMGLVLCYIVVWWFVFWLFRCC